MKKREKKDHRSRPFFEKKFLFLPGFFGGVTGVYKSFLRMHENDRDHMGICITCTDSPIT